MFLLAILLHTICISTAAAAPLVFTPIRIQLDTSLVDFPLTDNVTNGCNHACLHVGDVICDANGKSDYVCTGNDLNNATTRAAVKTAMSNAVSLMSQLLQVNAAGSVDLVNTQNCITSAAASYPNIDHVVYLTMRPYKLDEFPLPGNGQICNFSTVDGRPRMSQINVAPLATGGTYGSLASIALRTLIQVLGFDFEAVNNYKAVYTNTTMQSYFGSDPIKYPYGPLDVVQADGFTVIPNPAGLHPGDPTNSSIITSAVRFRLKTPTVVAMARDHFNCPTVDGILLEELNPMFMRWERRQLNFEVMTSELDVPIYEPLLSKFTVAAFEDMGFYRTNPSSYATVLDEYAWGYMMGCDFLKGCTAASWRDTMCSGTVGLAFDQQEWGACEIVDVAKPLDIAYQHFPGSPNKGGVDPYSDYCPYLRFINSDTYASCAAPAQSNNDVGGVYSDRIGGSSLAMKSTVVNQTIMAPDRSLSKAVPRCLEVVCQSPTSLTVRIGAMLYPCPQGTVLELRFPTSADQSKAPPPLSPSTAIVDYYYYGQVQCPLDVLPICNDNTTAFYRGSGLNALLTSTTWPLLLDVQPRKASILGGDILTVTGRNFRRSNATQPDIACRGLLIGGQETDFSTFNFVKHDWSTGLDTFTVNTSALPGVTSSGSGSGGSAGTGALISLIGGENADGSGSVDVYLLCRVSGSLQCGDGSATYGEGGYCGMSSILNNFTLTPIPLPIPPYYFLSDPINQIWVGILFVLFLALVVYAMVRYYNSAYEAPAAGVEDYDFGDSEEEEEGGGEKSQEKEREVDPSQMDAKLLDAGDSREMSTIGTLQEAINLDQLVLEENHGLSEKHIRSGPGGGNVLPRANAVVEADEVAL